MGTSLDDIIQKMRNSTKGIRYSELVKVCDNYFGHARHSSGSHRIYSTPWLGDPRINIQNSKGKAKQYQVKQVLLAIDKLKGDENV